MLENAVLKSLNFPIFYTRMLNIHDIDITIGLEKAENSLSILLKQDTIQA